MISIIIPNFNGKEHLKTCFDSIKNQTYKNYEIIFTDNNSADESVKFTEENYPEINIIKLDHNTGFARAVNEGIKNSKGEYVLLLNNDTECDKFFLEEMLSGFKSETTGSVACKMLNYSDRTKIDDAGDFIKFWCSRYARVHSVTDIGQYDNEEYIFGACAGAAIYKREVFDKVGLFDEDFFAYYEDVDFSFRMQLEGYKCYYNPKAVCYHKRGATTNSKMGFQTTLCEQNLIALRIKNYPAAMLLKRFPLFIFARIKRYFQFLTGHSFLLFTCAVKGYLKGIMKIPESLSKRKKIQSKRKVSTEYIESILK